MTATKTVTESTTRLKLLDPNIISIEKGFNPRVDFGDMEELEMDIRNRGVEMPLKVRKNGKGYILVDGNRRLICAQNIRNDNGAFKIPAKLVKQGTNEVDWLVDTVCNSSLAKPLLPFEEASAFKKMLDLNESIDSIAKKISRSGVYVRNRLSLLSADPAVKKAVEKGLPISTAEKIVAQNKSDPKKQKKLANKAVKSKEGKKKVNDKLSKGKKGKSKKVKTGMLDEFNVLISKYYNTCFDLGYNNNGTSTSTNKELHELESDEKRCKKEIIQFLKKAGIT